MANLKGFKQTMARNSLAKSGLINLKQKKTYVLFQAFAIHKQRLLKDATKKLNDFSEHL